MYSVALMVEEHRNILKLLNVVENACINILDGAQIIDEDFRNIINFVRGYADKHHHGKEEEILFLKMTENLGQIGAKLIKNGMLVEHDLGRLHIAELENGLNEYKKNCSVKAKLKILTEAMGYVNLLRRHIDKEDKVIYTYAENNLSQDILEFVDIKVKEFEENAKKQNIQDSFLNVLSKLENKYLN